METFSAVDTPNQNFRKTEIEKTHFDGLDNLLNIIPSKFYVDSRLKIKKEISKFHLVFDRQK